MTSIVKTAPNDAKIDNWELILKAWEASGLSQKSFCESRKIKYHNFVYHHSKKHQKKLIKFTELKVASADMQKVADKPIEIFLKSGVCIRVAQDESSLRLVLSVLSDLRC